jgi:hypothetical protein
VREGDSHTESRKASDGANSGNNGDNGGPGQPQGSAPDASPTDPGAQAGSNAQVPNARASGDGQAGGSPGGQ